MYIFMKSFQKGNTMSRSFMRTDTYDLQKIIQDLGADRRITRIFSVQLGQNAKGFNSLFYKICEESLNNNVGVKLGEMKSFETDNQKCQMTYEGGMGWDDKMWPLE